MRRALQTVGSLFLAIMVILPTSGFSHPAAEATPGSSSSLEVVTLEEPGTIEVGTDTAKPVDSINETTESTQRSEQTPGLSPNNSSITPIETPESEPDETSSVILTMPDPEQQPPASISTPTEIPGESGSSADESLGEPDTFTPGAEDASPTAQLPQSDTTESQNQQGPANSAGTLEIAPSVGPARTEVSLTGNGFEPQEVIFIQWITSAEKVAEESEGMADDSGEFRMNLTVSSSLTPGNYTIIASGESGTQAQTNFFVSHSSDPVITLSHAIGPAGAAITLSGQHFIPGEEVPLWWGDVGESTGIWLGTPTTLDDGTLRVVIESPDLAEPGEYSIYAAGEQGSNAETRFQVTAHSVNAHIQQGAPRARVTVSGEGLLPGDEIAIKWDSIFAWPLVSGTVSDAGTFSETIQVPADAMPGAATISVQTGRLQFDLDFEVTATHQGATVTISPTSGVQGDRLQVIGSNFSPGQRVNIRWDSATGPILGYKNADSNGSLSGAILVPADATAGVHSVYLESASGTAMTSFTVTEPPQAYVNVAPTTGRPGDRIVVTGGNFRPGDRVNIRWGSPSGPILGYKNATSTSTFSGVMLVPANAEAGATSIYLQSESFTASADFMVTAPPAASASVSPATGEQGDRLSITGMNFVPGERVNIRWGSNNGPILGYKTASSNGSLSGAILVPTNATAGMHSIYLQSASATASVAFTVMDSPTPTASISPTSGLPGARVSVGGTNFRQGERVNIRWGSASGPILGYKYANSNGAISGVILVPANASAGGTSIYLQSASASTSVAFTVTAPPSPSASVSPTSGLPGARLSVSGTNFKPGERVNMRWGSANGPILGYKNAASTGAVSGVILVPNDASVGSVRIYLQSASGTTSVLFTVKPKPKANVSLSYDWGTYGDVVGIQGWNFQPGESVTISFPGNQIVGRVTVRSDGTFSGRVSVPKSAAIGYNTIIARGESSGSAAGIRFEALEYVTTDVAVSPRALPGAVIEFAGQYFRPGEIITVYWSDLNVMGRTVARADGTISGVIMVPSTAGAGIHSVGFSNLDGTYIGVTSVAVVPIVAPYISGEGSGVSGRSVRITGRGFGPNERIIIGDVYTLEDVGIAYTNPAGEFVAYGTIPYGFNRATTFMAIGTTTELWATMDFFIIVSLFPLDTSKHEHTPEITYFQQWTTL